MGFLDETPPPPRAYDLAVMLPNVPALNWQPIFTALIVGVGALVALWLLSAMAKTLFWRALFWWKTRKRETTPYPCPICGYDIRATPHRCPECGTKLMWGVLPHQ